MLARGRGPSSEETAHPRATDHRVSDEYEYEPIEGPETPRGVEVPHDQLSPETLRQVIESFVHREGTDYGEREASLDRKVDDVMRQLENGEAVLLFDPEDESITIRGAGEVR